MKISGNLSSAGTILFSDIFGLFPHLFTTISSQLEADYRIVSYTDPGFSLKNNNGKLRYSSMQDYADELIEYLEANKISNIIYMAHSVNALLAFTAAWKAPHLFERIILTCAAPYLLHDAKTQYSCGFQPQKTEDLFVQLMENGNHTAYASQPNHTVQLTDILSQAFSKMTFEEAHSIFHLLLATDCRHFLSDFEVPVMILQVTEDKIATQEAGYFMYRTIPNSLFVRIKAKGHLPQADAPNEIIQAMKFFIQSTSY